MLSVFSSVKPLLRPNKEVSIHRPDNFIFKLHYRVTFSMLVLASVLVSSYNYIDSSGSAIQCMTDKGTGIPGHVINRYCWITSTYSLPRYYEGEVGSDFLHYGVGAQDVGDETVYHAYYQWVPLVLFFQACFFYAPHFIWKQMEGGRLHNLATGLTLYLEKACLENEDGDKAVKELSTYLSKLFDNSREHRWYASKFLICECLNLCNVVLQMVLTDIFLGHEFSTYGLDVLRFPDQQPEERVDPMSRVFPRMTKCVFHKFGGSGTIQKFDALCVLGMNILNEKIYIVLWFWFLLLLLLTLISLALRVMQFFCPNSRDRFVMLGSKGGILGGSSNSLVALVDDLDYSDYLVLLFLSKVLERKTFDQLVKRLASTIRTRSAHNNNNNVEPIGNVDTVTKERTLPSKSLLGEWLPMMKKD